MKQRRETNYSGFLRLLPVLASLSMITQNLIGGVQGNVCIKGDFWLDQPESSTNNTELTKLREFWQSSKQSGRLSSEHEQDLSLGSIYSGVTEDEFISYLKLWGEDGALVHIDPILEGKSWDGPGEPSDFTLQFWFKVLPSISNENMSLVQIIGDNDKILLKCIFSNDRNLICSSNESSESLVADLKDIRVLDDWIHVTVKGSKEGSAYLDVSKNSRRRGEAESTSFNFKPLQDERSLKACLGYCGSNTTGQGLVGGIREFSFKAEYDDDRENDGYLLKKGHEKLNYSANLLSYYRFSSLQDDERFKKDAYKDTIDAFIMCHSRDCYGKDIQANDICLANGDSQNYINFGDGDDKITIEPFDFDLSDKHENDEFEYTFSMTIFPYNEQTINPKKYQKTGYTYQKRYCERYRNVGDRADIDPAYEEACEYAERTEFEDPEYTVPYNPDPEIREPTGDPPFPQLFGIENLFQIYFSDRDLLQVHFITKQSFLDTYSEQFRIPLNQWVTIQIQLKQDNFEIKATDLSQEVVYYSEDNPIKRDIWGSFETENDKKAYIFYGFKGSVDSIKLCPGNGQQIPTQPGDLEDCFIDLDFSLPSEGIELLQMQMPISTITRSNLFPVLQTEPYESIIDVSACDAAAAGIVPLSESTATQEEQEARAYAYEQDLSLCQCMANANVLEDSLKEAALEECARVTTILDEDLTIWINEKQNDELEYYIQNQGSEGGNIKFVGKPRFTSELSPGETFFDGLVCVQPTNNLKIVGPRTYSQEGEPTSKIEFDTIPTEEMPNQDQLTVEFWFKLEDFLLADGKEARETLWADNDGIIFGLKQPDTRRRRLNDDYDYDAWDYYMYIRIKDSKLECLPFGPDGDVSITFEDFTYENDVAPGSQSWWHISCSYSKEVDRATEKEAVLVTGILYNRSLDQAEKHDVELASAHEYPKDGVMHGFFGHEGDVYDPSHIDREAVKSGFAIKEVRIWAEMRENESIISLQRNTQIDPTLYLNKNLISYYRLIINKEYGSIQDNFARHNKNVAFFTKKDATQPPPLQISTDNLQRPLVETVDAYYGTSEQETHIICSLHSYFHENRCFISPALRADLIVQPRWDEDSANGPLEWEFQVIYSYDLGNQDLLDALYLNWKSDDVILNMAFNQGNYGNELKRGKRVPSKILTTKEYKINVEIKDNYNGQNYDVQMIFVPLNSWFQPNHYNLDSVDYTETTIFPTEFPEPVAPPSAGRRLEPEIQEPVVHLVHMYEKGQEIKFQLTQHKNNIDVPSSYNPVNFYDRLKESIDFVFLRYESTERIGPAFNNQPQISVVYPKGPCYPVTLTIAAAEADKLPAGVEIDILMTIRWTNSNADIAEQLQKSQDNMAKLDQYVMQHSLYRVMIIDKSDLRAFLSARRYRAGADDERFWGYVMKNEDIILDASQSGAYDEFAKKTEEPASYQWSCTGLDLDEDICESWGNVSQKILKWNDMNEELGIEGISEPVEITVTVTHGASTKSKTLRIQWTNFSRLRSVRIVKVPRSAGQMVNGQNFVLQYQDMDPRSLDYYTIKWKIVDEQLNIVGQLENHKNFDTNRFELPDGELMLMVNITNDFIPQLQEEATTFFYAARPPTNGECKITDEIVLMGSTVSIKCRNWESSWYPLVYRVYQNGLLLSEEQGIPINDEFKLVVEQQGQFEIAISDSEGLTTRITIESNASHDFDRAYQIFWSSDTTYDGLIDAMEWSSYITEQLMKMGFNMPDIMRNNGMSLFYEFFDQCDSNFDGYINFSEFYHFSVNHQNQHDFIQQIRRISEVANTRLQSRRIASMVKYSNNDALVTPLNELQQMVDQELTSNIRGNPTTSMKVLDQLQIQLELLSIGKDSQILNQQASLSQYMSQLLDILQRVLQLPVHHEILISAQEILQDFADLKIAREMTDAEINQYHQRTLECLELMSASFKQGGVNEEIQIEFESWLANQIQTLSNLICQGLPNDFSFNYRNHDEIELVIQRVNMLTEVRMLTTLEALGARYRIDETTFIRKMPLSSGQMCIQFSGTRLTNKSDDPYLIDSVQARLTIYDIKKNVQFSISDAMNSLNVQFQMKAPIRDSLTCMSRQMSSQGFFDWNESMCGTNREPEKNVVNCICSALAADSVTIIDTDYDESIMSSLPSYGMLGSLHRSSRQESQEVTSSESTTSRISLTYALVSFLLIIIVPQIIANQHDRLDQISNNEDNKKTNQISDEFLKKVAHIRNQSYERIAERKETLQGYCVVHGRFMVLLLALHPLLSPFNNYKHKMSRLLQLNLYLLQVNLVQISTLSVFNSKSDSNLSDEIADNQIQMVLQTLIVASLLLLPILSQPLTWLLQGVCSGVFLMKSDKYLKFALGGVNLTIGLAFCVLAANLSSQMTASLQFCFVASLSMAIVIGTFGWNMLRITINWVLSPFRKQNCAIKALTTEDASLIYLDMEAVRLAQESMDSGDKQNLVRNQAETPNESPRDPSESPRDASISLAESRRPSQV